MTLKFSRQLKHTIWLINRTDFLCSTTLVSIHFSISSMKWDKMLLDGAFLEAPSSTSAAQWGLLTNSHFPFHHFQVCLFFVFQVWFDKKITHNYSTDGTLMLLVVLYSNKVHFLKQCLPAHNCITTWQWQNFDKMYLSKLNVLRVRLCLCK